MRTSGGELLLSASDLSSHLGCPHLTNLNLALARGELDPPSWQDPLMEVLRERGFQHELAYLEHLHAQGREVCELPQDVDFARGFQQTCAAMRQGEDVIVQATLLEGRWLGRADVLLRVDVPSALGTWSYEVADTKLARETRAGTILQLCLYTEMVAGVQSLVPENMYVVAPGSEFQPEVFRCSEFLAYHRLVKRRLEEAVADGDRPATYPEPCEQCDICRWWHHCDRRRRADDHLSLVAGISRQQRRELRDWDVATLTDLARLPLPLERRPSRGSREALVRVREQARVQLMGREQEGPVHELLPLEAGQGFGRLPEPSGQDIFLDLEGDPFAVEGGFVYLFGFATRAAPGSERCGSDYRCRWAFTPEEEKAGFEWLVDAIMDRLDRDPLLHVYHFAPYEPAALKRLMGRYATREDEIDRMLRAGIFVDLYGVVRRALRASVESYSIKELEQFCDFERSVPLRRASLNLHGVERAIALGETAELRPEALRIVEGYNRDDCLAASALRDWLEQLRAELVAQGGDIPRPDPRPPEPSETLSEWQEQIRDLKTRLAGDVPFARVERTDEQQARWILAELLEWHRREAKATWWEKFRLQELPAEELLFERRGLYGLVFLERAGGTDRCPVHRYSFVEQEFDIREDDELYEGELKIGTVVGLSSTARTVDIKKTGATRDIHPQGLFAHKIVNSRVLQDALFRLGSWFAESGIEAEGSHRASRDLLLGRAPRLGAETSQGHGGALPLPEEGAVAAARRLVLALDSGVLAMQGPPGSGKTFAGSRMICDLLRAGKRVGVTAVSHKVINNLLQKVVEAGCEEDVEVCCFEKPDRGAEDRCSGITHVYDNADIEAILRDPDSGPVVIGGTAWLWSRPELAGALDVLFVDEAGQMSLADALAASQAAANLVLLGDPQQLDQPIQGSHPDGTAVSALQHLLQEHKTMPPERGLFLEQTWRLHPAICTFTSELFYEGRLTSRPGLEAQAVVAARPFSGAGLWLFPVVHEGNQNSSAEEIETLTQLVELLLQAQWRDDRGVTHPLRLDDILIVCPCNAQVTEAAQALPGARVGTVDKFQGQEAPVVIYSMATSSPDDAPRGMEFLYSLNRLNVATSRARCATVLVASPVLFEPDCRTPRQMQLANAFCRYIELSEELRLET